MSRPARTVVYYVVLIGLILASTYLFGFVFHAHTWLDVVLLILGQMLTFVALVAVGTLTGFFRWMIYGFWMPGWRPCVCLDGKRVRGCTARTHRAEVVS
jgi:hypothetical protein